jgi:hydroxyacid-oxoacid transhydrogenase
MSPASRASVVRLLSLTANGGCRGCGRTHGVAHHHPPSPALPSQIHGMGMGMRGLATPIDAGGYNPPPGNTDYAFEVCLHIPLNSNYQIDE